MDWFFEGITNLVTWLSTDTSVTYGILLLLFFFGIILGTYGNQLRSKR
jgi:hypothetical protein